MKKGFTPLEVSRPRRLPTRQRAGLLTGFTLIELLVVITIIGVLSSMVLVSMTAIRAKARDARRESDIRQIMLSMELYYDDHLRYPEKGALGVVDDLPSGAPPYLDPLPDDPGSVPLACQPQGYRWLGNNGQTAKYCLWACLESSGTFFAASPKGTKPLPAAPTGLDCW